MSQSASLDAVAIRLTELAYVPRIRLVVDSRVFGCIRNVDAVHCAGSDGAAFAEQCGRFVEAGGAAELVPRIRFGGIGPLCEEQVADGLGVGTGAAVVEPVVTGCWDGKG